MEKSKVYFTKEITPESVVKMYEKLEVNLPGKVAVKLHSGEQENQNYIKPEFVKAIIERANGIHTIEAASKLGFGSREYEIINVD